MKEYDQNMHVQSGVILMDILEHTYVGESKQERSQRKGTEKDFASISYLSLAGITWKVPIGL